MTALTQYERARAALAECRRVDEVLSIRDSAEQLKLYARQAKDRDLMADAVELRLRSERQLGVLLKAAKDTGAFRQGKQKGSAGELSLRPTLVEAGIDKKLSSVAQKRAAMPESVFEGVVAETRARIASDQAKIINGERAIMASRVEPDDSLDFYPTGPWITRALFERAFDFLPECEMKSVWEPACGAGHMAEVILEYCPKVFASDIEDYGYGNVHKEWERADFFSYHGGHKIADWIITNPPFGNKTERFVLHALELAKIGVAVLVRLQWLETIGRYERLFRQRPPTLIAFFCERAPIHKGRWEPDGDTATAYIWLVWVKDALSYSTRAVWIPPGCREKLERPGDRERFTAHPVIRKEVEPAKVIEKPVAKPPLPEIEIPEAIRRVGT